MDKSRAQEFGWPDVHVMLLVFEQGLTCETLGRYLNVPAARVLQAVLSHGNAVHWLAAPVSAPAVARPFRLRFRHPV